MTCCFGRFYDPARVGVEKFLVLEIETGEFELDMDQIAAGSAAAMSSSTGTTE